MQIEDMTMQEYMSIRDWLNTDPSRSQGSTTVWRSLWRDSAASARALCERLRLVLEPTGRSRMAGEIYFDYKMYYFRLTSHILLIVQ